MRKFLKKAEGFTLVELIVVIAILGILAGVGTVGYSGYVKSAQKKADQTLVSNIVRAIEVGTNSTMFVNDDSFKMGQISYPIGFITLSSDGSKDSQVVTSKTQMKPNEVKEKGACVFETIEGVLVETTDTYKTDCAKDESKPIITNVTTGTITYCTTHSSAEPNVVEATGKYTYDYEHISGRLGCFLSGHTLTPKENSYPAGAKRVSNVDSLELKRDGSAMCEIAYAYQYDSFDSSTSNIGPAVSGNTLYDAIEAAFGDVESLKLQYNEWKADEGVDYATFYTAAPTVMGDIEELSGRLLLGQNLVGAGTLGLSKTYTNDEELLVNVAKLVVETYPEEDVWAEEWDMAAGDTWAGGRGFGLPGRETYSAARMGYNNAFGSYLDARQIESKYTDLIKNYYTTEMFGVGLPGLVNTAAFADDASGLKEDFKNAGDANAGQEGSVFNKCAALYEEYKDSAACEENGRVFYQTLATFHETSDIAQAQVADGTFGSDGTIYDYYNGYVNEISKMYEKAQEAAGDGIVIIVTVEGGEVKCNVSPSAAYLGAKE